jgi:hypothetical protein
MRLALSAVVFCSVYVAYVLMTLPEGTAAEKQIGAMGRLVVTGMQAAFVFLTM